MAIPTALAERVVTVCAVAVQPSMNHTMMLPALSCQLISDLPSPLMSPMPTNVLLSGTVTAPLDGVHEEMNWPFQRDQITGTPLALSRNRSCSPASPLKLPVPKTAHL